MVTPAPAVWPTLAHFLVFWCLPEEQSVCVVCVRTESREAGILGRPPGQASGRASEDGSPGRPSLAPAGSEPCHFQELAPRNWNSKAPFPPPPPSESVRKCPPSSLLIP